MARIYLVEDDDNIRKLICYALSKEGHDIIGFPTPGEFWEEHRLQKPELLLLDIMLPEEDGLSILKKGPCRVGHPDNHADRQRFRI